MIQKGGPIYLLRSIEGRLCLRSNSSDEANVERIDLSKVYEIGGLIHPMLELVERNPTKSDLFLPMLNAMEGFRVLLGAGSPAEIDLCKGDANAAMVALQSLNARFFLDAEGRLSFPKDPDEKVEPWELFDVRNTLQRFEAVFRAEMQKAGTYRVPKRGVYDVGDLVDRADNAFLPNLAVAIGDHAFREYRAAGRCFAFGLFTAAGYHSCRAMEAVLRSYYRHFTGKSDTGNETWGGLIGELESVSAHSAPSSKTLDQIRHVKDYFRNPLSHLRMELEEVDADILMSGTKIAMTAMAHDIMRRAAGPQQLELVSPPSEVAAGIVEQPVVQS